MRPDVCSTAPRPPSVAFSGGLTPARCAEQKGVCRETCMGLLSLFVWPDEQAMLDRIRPCTGNDLYRGQPKGKRPFGD